MYETHHGGIVRTLNDGVRVLGGSAVVHVQISHKTPQHTTLWGASAEGVGGGAQGTYFHILWAVYEEVSDSDTGGAGDQCLDQYITDDSAKKWTFGYIPFLGGGILLLINETAENIWKEMGERVGERHAAKPVTNTSKQRVVGENSTTAEEVK